MLDLFQGWIFTEHMKIAFSFFVESILSHYYEFFLQNNLFASSGFFNQSFEHAICFTMAFFNFLVIQLAVCFTRNW